MVQILASNENETTGTATADANTIVLRCSWDVDCRNTKFEVFYCDESRANRNGNGADFNFGRIG